MDVSKIESIRDIMDAIVENCNNVKALLRDTSMDSRVKEFWLDLLDLELIELFKSKKFLQSQ